jgi:hypothetical protein
MSGTIGDNVYRASGVVAAAAAAGGISWQSVVTASTLTAVAGNGYPINTTSNACTVTLPAAASVGDEIIFTDYARNWGTNAVTVDQNSLNYQGQTGPNPIYDTTGESIHIVYMDATKGWIPTYDGAVADEVPQTLDFLVIAGGASGGTGSNAAYREAGGGGGAGGYRTSSQDYGSTGVAITVTVGDGGAAVSGQDADGLAGSAASIAGTGFTTISSAGGGGGGSDQTAGSSGGSGGGGGGGNTGAAGGAGNTPSTDPVQGYAGGSQTGVASASGGGGGGASEAGNGTSDGDQNGGDGRSSSITGAAVTRAGGGGGTSGGAGGAGGGGGAGAHTSGDGTAGTVNTGSGGGGTGYGGSSGAGGKGVVILSMPTALYSTTITGSPTVTTSSGYTILTFTGDGTYTT